MGERVVPIPGGYQFEWDQDQIAIRIEGLHTAGRGAQAGVWCDLSVLSLRPGEETGVISEGRLNLRSRSAKGEWARDLGELVPDVRWRPLLEQLCVSAVRLYREGEPLVGLHEGDEPGDPHYTVEHIAPAKMWTALFGDESVGKSLLADTFAYAVADGQEALIDLAVEPGPVLILDWETDESAHKRTLRRLARGIGCRVLPNVFYRHMTGTLVDEIDQICRRADSVGAVLVIVDSLGPACGADIIGAEFPLLFHHAVRRLGRTVIALAQSPHAEAGKPKAHIYGSKFFQYLARSVWEVKGHQEEDGSALTVGLYHRKPFQGPKRPPIGLRYSFDDPGRSIQVSRCDVRDIPELAPPRTVADEIYQTLREGPAGSETVAKALGRASGTIRKELNRGAGRRWMKVGALWALMTERVP